MSKVLDELVAQLALEKIEENLFRGQSQDLGWGTVFGGQVLGQALSAAVQTVPTDRHVHSLHGYFLRPGAVDKPIVYDVDRIRDGGSFTTRRVVAIQNGKAIFNMAASFQVEEEGFDHYDEMPDVPGPDGIPSELDRVKGIADQLPRSVRAIATADRPFESRPVNPVDFFNPAAQAPKRHLWFKANDVLGDEPALHRYLLAYASDFSLLTTALLPHAVSWLSPGMQVASLDHAMWFHRPFRVDEWLLYTMDSESASGARGLVRGRVFDAQGRLVASVSQEGLIRQRKMGSP